MSMAEITMTVLIALLVGLCLLSKFTGAGKKIATYTVLILVAALSIFPVYVMFVFSTHSASEIMKYPPPLLFGDKLAENWAKLNESVSFLTHFGNSVFVSVSRTALVLLFCSMGGYAFAMYRFPGRDKLFWVLLTTMMIPQTAGMVPWFVMMTRFGWINSFLAVIVPNSVNAFGVFWMRQYCQNNVPASLVDAAKIDGSSEWLIFFRVIAPVLMPAFAALGIMQFVNSWNDFMQPLLVLRKVHTQTLPLMLRYLTGDPARGSDYGLLMFACSIATLPLLIAFLAASEFFISGLTTGAIKE